jgi:hypothetical protein
LAALVEVIQLAGISPPTGVQIDALTPFAVETRSPGVFSQLTTAEAEAAIAAAQAVFDWASALIH